MRFISEFIKYQTILEGRHPNRTRKRELNVDETTRLVKNRRQTESQSDRLKNAKTDVS